MSKGGKNLIILGVISIVIAMMTTGVSLALYHGSGDIYLDRSRPGFLPDEKEVKEEEEKKKTEEEFVFEKTGGMRTDVLDKYLEEIQKTVDEIDKFQDAFSPDALSDEALKV